MAQTYDSFKKTCKNGYPQYYGVTIDPVTGMETETEMNGADWVAAGQAQGYESMTLGCPPMYLAPGGVQEYNRKKPGVKFKAGSNLAAYNTSLGSRMKAPPSLMNNIRRLVPQRSYLLMDIRNAGGHVADPNNMFEIVAEYGRLHPELKTPDGQTRNVATMVPKSGSGGFDFGGVFGALGDLVTGIVNGVNNANVQAFLQNWANAFDQYMRTDFAAIQTTLNATAENPGAWGGWGPKGALDMLLQYKNTSWKDLKNTITNYCSQNGVDIPQAVKDYWAEQDALEQDLRNAVAASGNTGGGSPSTTPGGGGGGGSSFDFMKWLPWIIGVIVLIILIFVIVSSSKKSKG